jgi:hypothetical protein
MSACVRRGEGGERGCWASRGMRCAREQTTGLRWACREREPDVRKKARRATAARLCIYPNPKHYASLWPPR